MPDVREAGEAMTYDDITGLIVSAVGGGVIGYFLGSMAEAWKDRPYHLVKREDGGWYYVKRR